MPDKNFKTSAKEFQQLKNNLDAISKVANSLSGVIGSTSDHVTQFSSKLSEAAGAGASVASAITSMGGKLSGLSGPVGAAVSALTFYSNVVNETKNRIQELGKATWGSIQNTINALIQMGAVSKQQQLNMAKIELAKAESEKKMLQSRRAEIDQYVEDFKRKYPGLSGKIGQFVLSIFGEDYDTLLAKNIAETEAANAKIANSLWLIQTIQTQITSEQQEQLYLAEKQSKVINNSVPMKKLPTATPQSLFGGVDLGPQKISKVPIKETKEELQELSTESQAFISAFNSGMQGVGLGINQWVGGTFKSVFGEANSLLEMFMQNFFTSIAQTILSSIGGPVGGFLSSILGFKEGGIISEPIFGIGKSGQRYLFGEAGPEYIVPNHMLKSAASHGGRQASDPVFIVQNKITPWGLATTVERGNRILNQRKI